MKVDASPRSGRSSWGVLLVLGIAAAHVTTIRVAPRRLAPAELDALRARGYCVARDWLPAEQVAAIRADARALGCTRAARDAHVGGSAGVERIYDTRVRSSRMCPLHPPPDLRVGSVDLRSALDVALDELRAELCGARSFLWGDTSGMLPLEPFDSELAYLLYPPGGFYLRHRDTPAAHNGWVRTGRAEGDGGSWLGHENRREVSMLLYLNANWDPKWGGHLRIFSPEDSPAEPRFEDIAPEGGTLVLLKSSLIEHEVLLTAVERECVVGWFRSSRYRPSGPWAAAAASEVDDR